MGDRKAFLLRLTPEVYAQLRRWAKDELRSVNGQIEYLLVRALREQGRFGKGQSVTGSDRPGAES